MKNTSALLMILMFFLIPVSSHPQETEHMEHREAPHAHSPVPIPGSPEDIAYSESMHRLNGIFVLLLGGLALLEQRLSKPCWLRWGWPFLFFASGIYLVINSDPEGWPIGDKGFMESLHDPVIFQHKLAALILLFLGGTEFLLRTRWRQPVLAGVFPTLAILAGIMLVFHSHAGHHHSFKIVRQHQFMAGTAFMIGVTNFLSKRFEATKWIWPLLILLLGLELFFYSE